MICKSETYAVENTSHFGQNIIKYNICIVKKILSFQHSKVKCLKNDSIYLPGLNFFQFFYYVLYIYKLQLCQLLKLVRQGRTI